MEQMLTARDVCDVLHVSRATLYRMLQRNEMPRPVTVSLRAKRWRASEINQFMEGMSYEREKISR